MIQTNIRWMESLHYSIECTFYELLFDFDDKMVEILVKYEYDTRSQFFNKLCE